MAEGRLAGRVALVTGAAVGIGRGTAAVLAREGAAVAVVDVQVEEGERTAADLRAQGLRADFYRADVADPDQVHAAVAAVVQAYGGVDVLVNNAAVGVYKTILDTTVEEWDRCLAINLRGVFLMSREVVPYMQRRGRGSIVNVASVHAYQNVGATSPYAASKGGVVALTRTMAIDFARDGIRVNAVCPGWIDTPLVAGIFAASGRPEAMRREVAERQLLGRLGTPEEVGRAIAFLASEEASYITGASLFVDAGMTALLESW